MAQQLALFQALQDDDAPLKNEWYTPRMYIELAHKMLGGIDLDPASCAVANRVVRAARYLTVADDGLAQAWYGRVWLNPPYSPSPGVWVEKLIHEYERGAVSEALVLVPAKTDTGWFAPLFDYPICFVNHRIQFYGQMGSSNVFGSVFVYFGTRVSEFAELYGYIGAVERRIE